ncbi:hypothetical protein D3C87_1783220 [compost metagenome]
MSNVSSSLAWPAPAAAGWACRAGAQIADRARASASLGAGEKRGDMTEPVRACEKGKGSWQCPALQELSLS